MQLWWWYNGCMLQRWIGVNSRAWVKEFFGAVICLSARPYICLPVCCLTRCFGAHPSLCLFYCWAYLMLSACSTGGRVKTWKRRWFILTDNCLYYFEYTTVSTAEFSQASYIPLCEMLIIYIFSICTGQRAQRNHPTWEPEHQGGGG